MAIGGKNTSWKVATNAAPTVLTDRTSVTKSIDFPREAEEVDQTVFGATAYRSFEGSFKSATIDVTYYYTDALWAELALCFNNSTELDFEFAPDGTTAGKPKATGDCVLLNFSIAPSVGEALDITATYRVDGAITDGTYA